MKKHKVLAVTMAIAFVAVAFAGGITSRGSNEVAHYNDAEYNSNVMDKGYQVPPSNEGE